MKRKKILFFRSRANVFPTNQEEKIERSYFDSSDTAAGASSVGALLPVAAPP